tara:strand:+ start:2180 stop:3256 length:1077 start_codon:yes stop_codon:yes gene_type:complete
MARKNNKRKRSNIGPFLKEALTLSEVVRGGERHQAHLDLQEVASRIKKETSWDSAKNDRERLDEVGFWLNAREGNRGVISHFLLNPFQLTKPSVTLKNELSSGKEHISSAEGAVLEVKVIANELGIPLEPVLGHNGPDCLFKLKYGGPGEVLYVNATHGTPFVYAPNPTEQKSFKTLSDTQTLSLLPYTKGLELMNTRKVKGISPVAETGGALLLLEKADYEAAYQAFDKASDMFPESSLPITAKAFALLRDERYKESRECYQRILGIGANHQFTHANIAGVYILEDNWAGAASEFRAAVEIDPSFGQAWSGLGTVLIQQNNFHEAAHALVRARDINPEDPNVIANKEVITRYEQRPN